MRDRLSMRVAAITMVFNERVFLPLWLHHYGAVLGLGFENLYVIDDGSDDGSTSNPRLVNLLRKPRSPLDEDDRATLVSFFHSELLNFYDVVVYSDADELIVVDPKLGVGLADYLQGQQFRAKHPIGFNVVQRVEKEAPLLLDRLLFAQRSFVQFATGYSKPLISKVPIRWNPGFHYPRFAQGFDPNLLLFHLRAMDLDIAKRRHDTLRELTFSYNSFVKSHGAHYRLGEADYLRLIFPDDGKFEHCRGDIDSALSGAAPDLSILRVPDRFRDTIQLGELPAAAPTVRRFDQSTLDRLFDSAMRKTLLESPGLRRNDPCPCGSGKRFKHCHGAGVDSFQTRRKGNAALPASRQNLP